jgi:hypothetical protein
MDLVLDYDRKIKDDPIGKIIIALRKNNAENLHRFIMTSIEFSLDDEEDIEAWQLRIHAILDPIVKYRLHQKVLSLGEGDIDLDDKFKKLERELELAGSLKANR